MLDDGTAVFPARASDSILFFYLLRGIKATFTPAKALIFPTLRKKTVREPGCFFARQAVLRNKKLDIRQEFLKV
jgi:hypothetical protein